MPVLLRRLSPFSDSRRKGVDSDTVGRLQRLATSSLFKHGKSQDPKKKNTYSIFNFQENRSLGGFTGSFLCLFLHFCSKISFSQTFKMFKVCTAILPSKIQKYHAIYINTYIDIYFSFWLIQVPTVNARLSVEVGRMWHPHFSWFVPIEKHKGVVVECRVNNFTAGVSGKGRLVCLRSCNSAAVEKWHALWDLDARRNEWVICERGPPPPR